MMKESPGRILQKAREDRRITLQKAAEDTNITSRHLRALEEDNFGVFPGETYALGFLRNYANYLDVDAEYVIQLYRGTQIIEKEVPLEELTRPTVTTFEKFSESYRKLVIAGLVLAIVIIAGILFSGSGDSGQETSGTENQIENFLKNSTSIPDTPTDHISLRGGSAIPLLAKGAGIDFSIQNTEIYLILDNISYQSLAGGTSAAQLTLYPGKRPLLLKENEPQKISGEGIAREFTLILEAATVNNIKLRIEMNEGAPVTVADPNTPQVETNRIANPSNFVLMLDAEITGPNFIEYYYDGKATPSRQYAPGSVLHIEANDSIQIKIGDAGAIRLKINGKDYNLGTRGQTVNKIIRKLKDPITQTKFEIDVRDI